MAPKDTLHHELGYLESISNSSNPQFASNKVIKTIRGFSYESFMVFGKTTESNPKCATPTFHIKWVLNQVPYASFSVFGELGQFTETEHGRFKYPKSLAGLLRIYSKFFNSTFDLVSTAVSLTQGWPSHLWVNTLSFLLNKLQGYFIGTNGFSRPKHYKLILRWRFEVIRNNYESNETTIRSSHSVFQRHWYEIWWVKMHIYGNWKRGNYWTS